MADIIPEHQRTVAGVRFTKVGKLYHFDYSEFPDLQAGDYVIVETARGRHMGQVMGFTIPEDNHHQYRPILRPATPRDMLLRQQWQEHQPEALETCREKATQIGGYDEVKFVAAQYNYDGSVVTFLFSAEQKVNVGSLWHALKREFECQVEMRQIGPRDVAKLLGGYGACGELRCCSTFLTDFSPISIKMAKAQGISLNPSEITGMCGRLRCCLVYEYEQYVEARKQLPKKNKRVGTPLGPGRVIDVHPLEDAVTVFIDSEGRRMYKREELVPLEELEALERKSKEPCSKHGEDEACSCGQKPGERNQDRSAQAEGKQDPPKSEAQGSDEGNKGDKPDRRSKDKSGKKSRSNRSRKRRRKK
jgi:cell fate regulator YaaT (PSP1 superfamily)